MSRKVDLLCSRNLLAIHCHDELSNWLSRDVNLSHAFLEPDLYYEAYADHLCFLSSSFYFQNVLIYRSCTSYYGDASSVSSTAVAWVKAFFSCYRLRQQVCCGKYSYSDKPVGRDVVWSLSTHTLAFSVVPALS